MLHIGLTGGIAAGKSTIAAVLTDLGAHLIDADVIAREVVEPGTPGLYAVAGAFGDDILTADGTLDRPALGRVIFGDDAARARLNAIVHPLVGEATKARVRALPSDAIVVHDVPLIVENGLAANYHLVLVVGASEDVRLNRLVTDRGMTPEDARARIAAQADDGARRRVADVWIDNERRPDEVRTAVGQLWRRRIAPYARNLEAGAVAARSGPALLFEPPEPPRTWVAQADQILARLRRAGGERIRSAEHIGSTAVPGLAAKDVLDLQLGVDTLADADRIAEALGRAGFPVRAGEWADTPKPNEPDPRRWDKRLHGNADPGRAVNLHVRVVGGPAWTYALAFRDWLRADDAAREEYAALKRRTAAGTADTRAYAAAKEPWFTQVWPRLQEWVAAERWQPPAL
ncbi:dephospho-CoA kinase [Occultella gossypii]|uniref:Dephospho-CoA kinase n=1 Tax=Occultella gossypii TaxID=2800820 RepID=A0ABS7S2W9_9MICO|nr:dephospho-CoA kinase [Occultella gossypii]MBZ2194686.1 dephospho-CoA kinase [Occultella gossypii]